MTVLAWVLIALAVALAVFWLVVAMLLLRVVRAVRNSVAARRGLLYARRLQARGVRGDVVALQLRLDRVLENGRSTLRAASDADRPAPEAAFLLRRLDAEGESLSAALRLLAIEVDVDVVAAEYPTARAQVEAISRTASELRAALRDARVDETGSQISSLAADVSREAAAIRAGISVLHDLNRRELP